MKSRDTGKPPVLWKKDPTGNAPAPQSFIDLDIVPHDLSVVPPLWLGYFLDLIRSSCSSGRRERADALSAAGAIAPPLPTV